MQRPRRDVEKGLTRKGFLEREGKHHRQYIYHTIAGQKTQIRTYVSRGTRYRSLGDELLSEMSRQCYLKKQDFLKLVDCPLSHKNYELRLRGIGVLND